MNDLSNDPLKLLFVLLFLIFLTGGSGSSLSLLLGFLLNTVVHLLLLLSILLESGPDSLSVLKAIGDEDVVEDGAGLDLPQLEADVSAVLADVVDGLVVDVLRVGDHRSLPLALVLGIVDHSGSPLTLVSGIRNHGSLPFTIVLIIPVVGLLGLGVRDLSGLVVPVLGLLVLGIGDLGLIDPILGLLGLGVGDLTRRDEGPEVVEGTLLLALTIDEVLEGVVGLHNEGVEVGESVDLGGEVLGGLEVLALVAEDDVGLLLVYE